MKLLILTILFIGSYALASECPSLDEANYACSFTETKNGVVDSNKSTLASISSYGTALYPHLALDFKALDNEGEADINCVDTDHSKSNAQVATGTMVSRALDNSIISETQTYELRALSKTTFTWKETVVGRYKDASKNIDITFDATCEKLIR